MKEKPAQSFQPNKEPILIRRYIYDDIEND